uniref:Non-structural protein 3a n=1 Tax=Infectious bronchitis virus TaxID=11120 RepID=A0A4Y5SXJ9_9GAMC|nr:ORF3a [Infectious bronchitis virus]
MIQTLTSFLIQILLQIVNNNLHSRLLLQHSLD